MLAWRCASISSRGAAVPEGCLGQEVAACALAEAEAAGLLKPGRTAATEMQDGSRVLMVTSRKTTLHIHSFTCHISSTAAPQSQHSLDRSLQHMQRREAAALLCSAGPC